MTAHDTNPDERQPLMATREVAEMLGMSREQVWRMFNTGRLPAYRFDRLLRFAQADIERFMTEHYEHGPREDGPPQRRVATPNPQYQPM